MQYFLLGISLPFSPSSSITPSPHISLSLSFSVYNSKVLVILRRLHLPTWKIALVISLHKVISIVSNQIVY